MDHRLKKKLQVGHRTGKWYRYFGHPGIYPFLDVLQNGQTTNYIKIRNMNLHVHALVSKAEKESCLCFVSEIHQWGNH